MKKKATLTELGKYLFLKSANKASIFRKTGISETRLSLLSNDPSTILSAKEAYLISLALDVETNELLGNVYPDVKLNSEEEQDRLANKSRK